MSTIIISSDVPALEKQIALQVAKELGYQSMGPEILTDIAKQNNIPVEGVSTALEKTPSAIRREATKRWLRHLACIEADVLERLKADNIVCWGLAAHLYVLGVSHVMKVRLLSDSERQAKEISKASKITEKKAQRQIQNRQRKREQWSTSAYGRSELDPGMYDLVIKLEQIEPDEAVRTISGAIGYRKFQPMTYSMKSLAEGALAAKVRAKLLASIADVRVEASDGRVKVTSKALKRERTKKAAAIKQLAGTVEGVEFVEVHLINYVIRAAAESYR